MRYTLATLFMTLLFAVGLNSTFSQSIVIVEVDVSSQPIMIRVAGNTGVGYVDRIVEIPSETQTDTVFLEIFHDFCALPGAFQVYDTTFAIQSSFPFDMCVTVFKDTLTQESPCDNWNLDIDTGQTVCLTADQILSAETFWQQNHIKLYPNPTERYLMLETNGIPEREIMYSVRDMNGRELLSGQIEREPFRLDLGRLSSGVFVLELRSEKGVLRRRFVKSE